MVAAPARWHHAGPRRDAGARVCAAALGDSSRPAIRLQRRRSKAFRSRGCPRARWRLSSSELHQPTHLCLSHLGGLLGLVRRRGGCPACMGGGSGTALSDRSPGRGRDWDARSLAALRRRSAVLWSMAGLLAAAAMAVAFLPVFYSHQALNDVPAMTALTLSLVGTAGALRSGRAVDYALGVAPRVSRRR